MFVLPILQLKAANYYGVGKQSVKRMDLSCSKSEEKTTPTTGSSVTSNNIYKLTTHKV